MNNFGYWSWLPYIHEYVNLCCYFVDFMTGTMHKVIADNSSDLDPNRSFVLPYFFLRFTDWMMELSWRVIFFVFHLILTNVLYLTNNSWALRAILQFVKRSITRGHYHILVTLICHFDRSAKNYLLYDNQHTYIIFRQYDWKESGTNIERNLEAYIILDWPRLDEFTHNTNWGPSWSWPYDSLIYICNQCLSPLGPSSWWSYVIWIY
jgi:hypothetical protein